MIEELKRPEVRAFLKAHENDDPAALVLKYAGDQKLPIQLAVTQIAARQKAKTKLPFFYQNDELIFPHGVSLEQCSSEATAHYKSSIFQGNSLTDLTGGFGVDTYFLSQGFESTHYVEQNEELAQLAQYNFEILKAKVKCHPTNAEEFLNLDISRSDCYFIDPARRDGSNQKVFRIDDCQPYIKKILPFLLERQARILVKMSPILDIQQALNELSNVSEVHVVSVNNECKELLFLIGEKLENPITIFTVNLKDDQSEYFSFYREDEKIAPNYALPARYIYEPNASIMKAGGFNSVARKFKLAKLHPNSHLYTSNEWIADFPGRAFELMGIESLNKKKLMACLDQGKANITVRNFPISVKEIRQKTGIKEGGDYYLFATTLEEGSHKILISRKVSTQKGN